jgi:hypothetical protein
MKKHEYCADGCQFSKDVGMYPEYSCSGLCVYESNPSQSKEAEVNVESKQFAGSVSGVPVSGTVSRSPEIPDYHVALDIGNTPELMRLEFTMTLMGGAPPQYVVNRIDTVIGYGPKFHVIEQHRLPPDKCFEDVLGLAVHRLYSIGRGNQVNESF